MACLICQYVVRPVSAKPFSKRTLVPSIINRSKIVKEEKLPPKYISKPVIIFCLHFGAAVLLCQCKSRTHCDKRRNVPIMKYPYAWLSSSEHLQSAILFLPLYSYFLHRCFGNPLYCEVLCQDLLSKDILLFCNLQKEEEEKSKWETLSGKLSFPGFYPGTATRMHLQHGITQPF